MHKLPCPSCGELVDVTGRDYYCDIHYEDEHGMPAADDERDPAECACGQLFTSFVLRNKHLQRYFRGIEPDHSYHATMEALRRL